MAGLYSAPSISTLIVDQFKGVDLSVPEDQMKPYRAASCENLIPGATGEVKKRPGVQFQRSREVPLNDGAYVTEMIGGVHSVVYSAVSTVAHYRLFYKNHQVLCCYHHPVAIPYGKGWIIFATQDGVDDGTYWREDIGDWRIGGKTTEDYGFYAAVAVFDIEGPVRVYTDRGYCCTMDENGTWSSAWILPNDPLLTTPTILKGCDPAGGGSTFQQINLLSPWVTESFCCKEAKTSVFYLNDHVADVSEDQRWSDKATLERNFKVEVLATIDVKDEGTNETTTITRWVQRPFTANGTNQDGYRTSANRIYLDPAGNGDISYVEGGKAYAAKIGTAADSWIGPSPIEGEDNVRITHWRADFKYGLRRVCAAVCGTVFGVGGYKDRLFLGGCQNGADGHRERIYYSEMEDPFYIGDLNYIKLEDGCRVMALDGTADVLAALTDRGIYLIGAQAQQNTNDVMYVADALFTVSKKVLAPAPLHYGDTEVLGGEIVYLSEEGVVAITYKENFNERYAEHRSAMIDPLMMKDRPQQLISLGRFLMIRCADGIWWLLDENQPNGEGNKPYSSHQYEGWRLSGMPADTAWAEGSVLHLLKGNVECIWTDGSGADHYRDSYTRDGSDATAIVAFWETPWIYGRDFYRNKIFMRLGVLLESVKDVNSAVKVEGRKNEEDWKLLWDYDGSLCTFNYGTIDYRLFTYAGEPSCPDLSKKIKIKKAKRFKLRFSNDFIDQALILRQFGLDYVQEG